MHTRDPAQRLPEHAARVLSTCSCARVCVLSFTVRMHVLTAYSCTRTLNPTHCLRTTQVEAGSHSHRIILHVSRPGAGECKVQCEEDQCPRPAELVGGEPASSGDPKHAVARRFRRPEHLTTTVAEVSRHGCAGEARWLCVRRTLLRV